MKYYLSSFKIGNQEWVKKFRNMLPNNNKAAYVSNGFDFIKPENQKMHAEWDIRELTEIGLVVEPLDLRDYFDKGKELKEKLKEYGVIYVSGGNVFDLRIAMRLSGFDKSLESLLNKDIIYAGYSAAVCVLSPTLKGYHVVHNPDNQLYGDYETIWDGLGLIDWQFAPHYDSDHPESEDIDKEIDYCKENNLPFRTLRDGEVIILD